MTAFEINCTVATLFLIIIVSIIRIFVFKIRRMRYSYENRINWLTEDRETLKHTLYEGVKHEFDRTVKRYVIIKTANGKEYTLPADVLVSVCTVVQPEYKFRGWNAKEFRVTAYVLLKLYWECGDFLRFASGESMNDIAKPQLVKLNKPVTVTDLSGNEYKVTLTNEPVDEDDEINRIRAEIDKFSRHIKTAFNDLRKLRDEVLIDYPYFATLIADYEKYTNDRYARELKHKNRPAPKAAQIISNNSEKIRSLTRENKLLTYQMEIYESFFPFLADYKEISKEDCVRESETATDEENERKIFSEYLSPEEYNSLSPEEKCTLALERYKKKKKTLWQIGRDYERYIGYLYESKGYAVEYFGAVKGLADLGRDLIATKGSETLIIQCKYWNEHKTVHEKHIFQLFGTSFEYTYQHPNKNVKAVFVTSTGLSEMSLKFAESLHIEVIQNLKYDNTYPMIKCNINRTTGEKIFHLPFDLQYDNVIIEPQKGECYAATVAEAAEKGFRHSYKWHTSKPAD